MKAANGNQLRQWLASTRMLKGSEVEGQLQVYSRARLPDVNAAVTMSVWKHDIALSWWGVPIEFLETMWALLRSCFPGIIPPTAF